jgi:REase_DpnII-MboI
LEITDEYDTQDLFHALLKIFFQNVESEEWTPNYAGGCSRVDFLLPDEKIMIELKKTRSHLGAKEVGNQLLIDIVRYRKHPDYQNLICFVYDPEGIIGNPRGLEKDLDNLSNEHINIITIIRPN